MAKIIESSSGVESKRQTTLEMAERNVKALWQLRNTLEGKFHRDAATVAIKEEAKTPEPPNVLDEIDGYLTQAFELTETIHKRLLESVIARIG